MSLVTSNELRDAVMEALEKRFPSILITGEAIEQGLNQKKYFFVYLIQSQHTALLGRRGRRTYYFDVHYFHDTTEQRPLQTIADELYEVLHYIITPDAIYQGRNMQHKVVDGVLHFLFEVTVHVYQPTPEQVRMEQLDTQSKVKGG